MISFNTASGKYYCNVKQLQSDNALLREVSIPQAVSTIAIVFVQELTRTCKYAVSIPQAVSTIAILQK